MAKDIGQIGSAYVQLETRSNVREGVQKAVQEAKQEAAKQRIATPEEAEQYTNALRNRLAAEKDARLLSLYGTADAARINQMGAARTLPDKRADDTWQNRIRKPHAAGDVMQRLAGLYETDRGRGELAKQLHQEKLAHDAQKRIDFERMRVSSGTFAAHLNKASENLKPWTVGVAAAGASAFLLHNRLERIAGLTALSNPLAGWRSAQASRDVGGAIGKTLEPITEAWTEIKRKFGDTLVNDGFAKSRKELTGMAQTGIMVGGGMGMAAMAMAAIKAIGWFAGKATPIGWGTSLAMLAGGAAIGKGAQNFIDAEAAKNPNSSFGIGGVERLGQWFGGADEVWKAAASAASQTPFGGDEKQLRVLEEIRDKLPEKNPQQMGGWEGFWHGLTSLAPPKGGLAERVLFGPQ